MDWVGAGGSLPALPASFFDPYLDRAGEVVLVEMLLLPPEDLHKKEKV